MKRLLPAIGLLLALWSAGNAHSAPTKTSASGGFPQTVRVRLWYLHPPQELRLRADAGQAELRTCATCKPVALATLALKAAGSSIRVDNNKSLTGEVRISGAYQMNAAGEPLLRAD